MRIFSVPLLVTLTLAACASQQSNTRPSPPSEPDAGVANPKAALAALFDRESQPAAAVSFQLGERTVTTESSQPVTAVHSEENGSTELSIGVGASSPMTCYLYDQPMDMGHVLANSVAGMRTAVEITVIKPGGIELIEKSPAIFLQAFYLVDQGGQKAAGMVSMMAYASDLAPLYCLFDEPGYGQSFRRVASSAAAALAKALTGAGASPTYRNISLTKVKDLAVSFTVATWRRAADGSGTFLTETTTVAPLSANTLMLSDQTIAEKVAKDGTLKERHTIIKDGEKVARDVTVTRLKAGVYRAKGTATGTPVDVELKTANHKDLPSSVLIARWTTKQLLPGKVSSLAWEDFTSKLDALTPVTLAKGPGADTVVLDLGTGKLTSTVDAYGVLANGSLETSGVQVVTERGLTEGALE